MNKIKVKYLWILIAILFVIGCLLVFTVTLTEGFWTDVFIVLIAIDFIVMTLAIQVASSKTFKYKRKEMVYPQKEYSFSKGIEVTLKKQGYKLREFPYGNSYLKIVNQTAYKVVFVKDYEKYFAAGEEESTGSSNKDLAKCTKFIGFELFLKYDEETLKKLVDFCMQGEKIYYAGFYYENNVLVCPNYIEPNEGFSSIIDVMYKDLNMKEKEDVDK